MTTGYTPTGVIFGASVSAQGTPDTTVAVAAGYVIVAGQVAVVAAGNLTPAAADAVFDRIDSVVSDNTGTTSIVQGSYSDGPTIYPPVVDETVYALLGNVYIVNQGSTQYTGTIVGTAIDTSVQTIVSIPEPANTLAYTFLSAAQSNSDPGAGSFGFDTTDLTTIAHAYINYSTPTIASGAAGGAKEWLQGGSGGSPVSPWYLRTWSRKSPGAWVLWQVTSFTNHTTYCDLALTRVASSNSSTSVPLSTDPVDTILEWCGAVPPTPTTWTIVSKTANTSRASTTALTADPNLQFAMAANTNYIIRGAIRFDSNNATPGFKFDFDGPASPTRVMVSIWDCAQGGTPAALALDAALNVAHTLASAIGNTPGYVGFEIIIENGANAGTFSLRWAQNTSNVAAVNVRPGSYMEYFVS